MLSTMNYSDAGVDDGDLFPGILHIACTIKQHQVNNSLVVSLFIVGIFVSLIRDIIGFKSPRMYLASFFSPFAVSLVQSTLSSNANVLFGLDPKKIIIGTFWIVAPLPNNVMPKTLDSLNRDLNMLIDKYCLATVLPFFSYKEESILEECASRTGSTC